MSTKKRHSKWTRLDIVKKPHPGFQFAPKPIWKQLQPISINVGEREKFNYTNYIENATPLGTYDIETSGQDRTPLAAQLSGIMEGQDETQPIVKVDASNVQVQSNIYFRLVHIDPNGNAYKSLWTSLTIRQTNNVR